MTLSALVFTIFSFGSIGLFSWKMKSIIAQIKLGKAISRSDRKAERWKTMLLVAFGQKKMFTRPIPAILHLCIYTAIVITQIELIEIVVDGILGDHRIFRGCIAG